MNKKTIITFISILAAAPCAHASVAEFNRTEYQYANVCMANPTAYNYNAEETGKASFKVEVDFPNEYGGLMIMDGAAICANAWHDGNRYTYRDGDGNIFCLCKIIAPFVGPWVKFGVDEDIFHNSEECYWDDLRECEKQCSERCAYGIREYRDFFKALLKINLPVYNEI